MGKRKQAKVKTLKKDNLNRYSEGFKAALIASLLLHSTGIGLLFLGHSGGGSGGGNSKEKQEQESQEGVGKKDDGDIIPKEDKRPLEIDVVPEDGIQKKKQEPAHAKDICPDFFGGIGVQYSNQMPGLIVDVPTGYPAQKAGIKPGDRILSPSLGEIRGEVGTEVTVTYESSDGPHTVTLVRDKICIDKKTERAYP